MVVGLGFVALLAGYRARGPGVEDEASKPPSIPLPEESAAKEAGASAGDPRGFLYGRVTVVDGATYEGRLRFGRDQEAFWSDPFHSVHRENRWAGQIPAERLEERRPVVIFGVEVGQRTRSIDLGRPFVVRFGDLARLEARGREVLVTLKSGTVVALDRFEASDFDDGLRVWDGERGVVDLDSLQISAIDFLPTAPQVEVPGRLHGTVRTKQGDFTGFVLWNRWAALGTDELLGRAGDDELRLRFDSVRSIERRERDGSIVTLVDGREVALAGIADVGRGHRGLAVDDPRFGRVRIPWEAFERVDFDAPGGRGSGPAYGDFLPGRPLTGSVTTRGGRRLSGRLVFDLDESETTELLDAPSAGIDYSIPFGKVAAIELPGAEASDAPRARVSLHDGEELRLELAGDLGARNAGLLVFAAGSASPEHVPWSEVERIDFDRPPTGATPASTAAPAPNYLDRHCAALAASAQPPLTELLARLKSDDEEARSLAADDLACRGEAARPAVPAMIRLFASEMGETQANAIEAVARLGEVAVPALVAALDDPERRVRDNACRALKRIGPTARSALAALAERRDRDGYDAALIELAIVSIESSERRGNGDSAGSSEP